MPHTIIHKCVCCAACEFGCLNGAIHWRPKIYTLDPSSCTECMGCFKIPRCAEVCPVRAVILD